MAYNGWSNRETWLVGLWFNPETKNDVEILKEQLSQEYYESGKFTDFWSDMVSFSSIDWRELKESCESDTEVD